MLKNIILIFTALLSICIVLPLQAESCNEIDAEEAINIALQKAYSFSIEKIAGDKGSCTYDDLDNSIAVGVAGLETGSITCLAGFFLGDIQLKEGWTIIKSPTFSGANYKYAQEPAYGTNNPGFKITFDVEPDNPVVLKLKSINLEGPECKKWKDAF